MFGLKMKVFTVLAAVSLLLGALFVSGVAQALMQIAQAGK